jgi:hypothetical protein
VPRCRRDTLTLGRRRYEQCTRSKRAGLGDVLVCIADGHGLQKGELYFKVIEVIDAEAFLRRTRVLVEVMAPHGQVTVRSFPDAEQFDVWCAFTRTPANRVRNKRYVEAEPTPPKSCRFTAVCVPGELDMALTHSGTSTIDVPDSDKVGAGPQSRSLAVWTAREANRVQNESEREEAAARRVGKM